MENMIILMAWHLRPFENIRTCVQYDKFFFKFKTNANKQFCNFTFTY